MQRGLARQAVIPQFLCSSTSDPWNYLTVQLNRTSAYGDPDLFGMFDAVGNKVNRFSRLSAQHVPSMSLSTNGSGV